MRILLDECLPVGLRHQFAAHETHTAEFAGLKGKTNGELIRAAEMAGYDVLVTVDQGIPRQQGIAGRKLAIVLVRCRTNQMEDLLPLTGLVLTAIERIQPGDVVTVSA
jgi:predicted nuclease of predicted toxin-antitoxin system